jgi:hypothetical protein
MANKDKKRSAPGRGALAIGETETPKNHLHPYYTNKGKFSKLDKLRGEYFFAVAAGASSSDIEALAAQIWAAGEGGRE